MTRLGLHHLNPLNPSTLGWGSFRSIQKSRRLLLNDQGRPREIWPLEVLDFVKRAGLKYLDIVAEYKVVKSPVVVGDFHIKRNGIYSASESGFWRPGEGNIVVASVVPFLLSMWT
jgi:hypothetical protein